VYDECLLLQADFRFCENMTKQQLKLIGEMCGLDIGDWARSTRWVNLPEVANYRNKHVCTSRVTTASDSMIGMFFEVPTIWKEKICHRKPAGDSGPPKWTIPTFIKRSSSSGVGKVSMNRTLPIWRPRRVGVFVSKNQDPNPVTNSPDGSTRKATGSSIDDNAWTCLVLVEPLEKTQNDFVFCYRKVAISTDFPPPNARTVSGHGHYSIEESDLQGLITYLVDDLLERYLNGMHKGKLVNAIHWHEAEMAERCAKFVTELGKDIFWGWEEFTTQVVQFSAVNLLIQLSDNSRFTIQKIG